MIKCYKQSDNAMSRVAFATENVILGSIFQLKSHLFSILISLPICDTVLLGDVLALRNHLEMRNSFGSLLASLLYKQLGSQLSLVELLRNHSHGTLSVRNNLTSGLHHISTNIFLSVLAFLDKNCVTFFAISLYPLDGLVGGYINTKLLGPIHHQYKFNLIFKFNTKCELLLPLYFTRDSLQL